MPMTLPRLWAIERGTLWTLDLSGEAPAAPAPAPVPHLAATLGEVPPEGAQPLAAAMGLAGPGAVRRRFESGRRCFAAWVAREIVAYGWVSHGEESVGELERSFYMQP